MIRIPLEATPNQFLTVYLEGSRYEITLKMCNGILSASITRDGQTLFNGLRVVAGVPLIPYSYLENGNFIFTTEDEELPVYTKFGSTQALYYLTMAEIGALRNAAA